MLSKHSQKCLDTCHPDLISLISIADKDSPIIVRAGHYKGQGYEGYFHEGGWPFGLIGEERLESPSTGVLISPRHGSQCLNVDAYFKLNGIITVNANILELNIEWTGDNITADMSQKDVLIGLSYYTLKLPI